MSILEVNGLSKSYGKTRALDGVSLTAEAGQIIGILGPNGSGKTTMIKILTGLISDYAGEVHIDGIKPGPESSAVVSYLPDRIFLPTWMKVRDTIKLFKDFYKDFDEARGLSMLGEMGVDLSKKIKALSKGTAEKLQLALIMSRRARLYVLDEPIAAVDPAARDFIIRTILTNFNENSAILLSTHLIGDIETILDHAVFLKEGAVTLSETADSLRERTGQSIDQLFREVFKC